MSKEFQTVVKVWKFCCQPCCQGVICLNIIPNKLSERLLLSWQFNWVLLLLSELSIIQSPVLLLDLGQVWVWPEETWKIYRQLPASEFLTFDLQEIHSCPSDAMAHPLWSSRVTWQRRKIAQGYHVIHSLASTVRILSICSLELWPRQWKSLEGWMCW